MNKLIVALIRTSYGFEYLKDFRSVKEYLEWRKECDYERWNPRNELYLELIKVYTLWLALDWERDQLERD